jgi:hypothetical protein
MLGVEEESYLGLKRSHVSGHVRGHVRCREGIT